MRYAQIRKFDVTNGPNVRTALFVSGCNHNCPGCFNKDQQDFNYGELWTEEVENYFMECVNNVNILGVNILGGEPLEQTMDESLLRLLKRIKEETNKSIWLWTGFLFEDILKDSKKSEFLKYVDVIIDGRFLKDKRNISLKYRGSSNQRVIDVEKSLKNKEIIEIEL